MGWNEELWPEWTIESSIGAGANGNVYKIVRKDIGGTYYAALKVVSVPGDDAAVKDLRNSRMDDDQIREYYDQVAANISREFAVMERLKGNTNIVSYEDHKIVPHEKGFGCDILIRMELLTPLDTYYSRVIPWEPEIIKLGMDICSALILCERENVIHRDIKPGNIFVNNYGDYKLGDFGISLVESYKTHGTSPKGTYNYMAPEVFHGKPYNHTIDLYSLGLILYKLLNVGRLPFLPLPPHNISHEMIEKAAMRRMNGKRLPKPVNASRAMAAVLDRACAYSPRKRFQSAKEFRDALAYCRNLHQPPLPMEHGEQPPEVPEEKPAMDEFFSEGGDL